MGDAPLLKWSLAHSDPDVLRQEESKEKIKNLVRDFHLQGPKVDLILIILR